MTAANRDYIINTMGVRNAWIGGADNVAEGTFRWVDGPDAGDVVPSNYWGSGEPSNSGGKEDCIQIRSDGAWNDADCGSSMDSLVAYPQYEDAFCMPCLVFSSFPSTLYLFSFLQFCSSVSVFFRSSTTHASPSLQSSSTATTISMSRDRSRTLRLSLPLLLCRTTAWLAISPSSHLLPRTPTFANFGVLPAAGLELMIW